MARNKEYKTYIERKPRQMEQSELGSRGTVREASDIDREEKEIRKAIYIKKKRKKKIIKKVLFGLLLSLSLIGGWAVATIESQVNATLNRIDRDSLTDLSSVELGEGTFAYDKDVINILLVGSDKRATWTEKGRSDSTMIATLDLKNKRLKLTSLMRDMYLTIPEYGEDRFNAAYAYGGVRLLYETVASNFGIRLDGYVIVDFSAFKAVIDTLGGVEIELTDGEHKYLTTAYKKGDVLLVKPGLNNMNGVQALAYTRIRQDAKGDFGRTERQRKVLQSIFNEGKKMSYTKLMDLTNTMMPYLSTDLTNDEIISYMKSVLMLGTTEINQMRIPVDNSYTQDRIRNMAVLIPDMEINRQAINDFIFNYDGEVASSISKTTDAIVENNENTQIDETNN